ncbi:HNH endonuclease [Rhodococcus sp. G-MC3]|uniref:HNH endonuclease signature motif containing protein n=1 Tax=Rhodococcus sp. G-MC3 TaxID=3046209 RepID=UPI0024B92844|nr:HNH endonuclease [Rhodococcus sp. G-MC3]MDJ0392548.1 HNH endonuclease [Rhodococcus sp. G-MC3]
MFDTGVSAGDVASGEVGVDAACSRVVDDAVAAGLLGFSARSRVAENIARAKVVESACEVAEIRLAAGEDEGDDPATVMRSVVCEVAAGLNVSQKVASPFVEVGSALDRLPLTSVRFVYGNLDWARTQVIAQVLGKACDATIKALEFEAVAAAEFLGPRSLRLELWALWAELDEAEASAAKGTAVKGARGVSIKREGDGTSMLEATLTDIEGAEADELVEEIAGTVCAQDPRSAKSLRADGLLALIHGEHALECRCDLGENCPQFGVADRSDGRRGHLLQIVIDVETLLGLTSTPARLADGTPLDSEVARVLAEDARWQGLLTELITALAAHGSDNTDTNPEDGAGNSYAAPFGAGKAGDSQAGQSKPSSSKAGGAKAGGAKADTANPANATSAGAQSGSAGAESADNPDAERTDMQDAKNAATPGKGDAKNNGAEPAGAESNDAEPAGAEPADVEPTDAEPAEAESAGPTSKGGIRVPRLLYRGRIRPAATVPPRPERTPGSPNRPPASTSGTVNGAVRAHAIAALLSAIDRDPALANGIFPDGHGGLARPPAGALTYTPSTAVAARVRMTYRRCTHPGCEIPSTRCQLDHIVPFDHDSPSRGGWSIETNLHPACGGHHQLKTSRNWTIAYLAGGAILWTSRAGIRAISLPELGCPTPPRSRKRRRKAVDPELDIHALTWWERHMPADTPEPTAADQRAAETDDARTRIRLLRRRLREHKTIRKLRKNAEPPPF